MKKSAIFLVILITVLFFLYLQKRPYLWKHYFAPSELLIGNAVLPLKNDMYVINKEDGWLKICYSDRKVPGGINVRAGKMYTAEAALALYETIECVENCSFIETEIAGTYCYVLQCGFVESHDSIVQAFGFFEKDIYFKYVGQKKFIHHFEPIIRSIKFVQ